MDDANAQTHTARVIAGRVGQNPDFGMVGMELPNWDESVGFISQLSPKFQNYKVLPYACHTRSVSMASVPRRFGRARGMWSDGWRCVWS